MKTKIDDDFLDSCIDEQLSIEIKRGSVDCLTIIKNQIQEQFDVFSLSPIDVFKLSHSGHFLTTEGLPLKNTGEDNKTVTSYHYGYSVTNIREILRDCYILKVFYEKLIGCEVKFDFRMKQITLEVILEIEWDDIFDGRLPEYKGSSRIKKEQLLPENIWLTKYIRGSNCEEDLVLFDLAYHGEFYHTNSFSQIITQVKAFVMSNHTELIEHSVFFNGDEMTKEYGVLYATKIKDVFSNPIHEESKKQMGKWSVEGSDRLYSSIKSFNDAAEHKDCPSCHSSRTKFIKDFGKSLYLCFACDDNFDIEERGSF